MADASSIERAARGAGSGLLLDVNGKVVDATALLQRIAAGVGADSGADFDTLLAIAQAQLVQLEQIQGTNAALNTVAAAIQAISADIRTAAQIIDNYVGVIDAAHGTGVAVLGGKAETGVPVAVADGRAVAAWVDAYGRLVQLATDVAQGALSVNDIAPAQMQTARWLDWVALTAPAQVTPAAVVQGYKNLTLEYIIATIDTSVDLILWGSVDGGTTSFVVWSDTIDNTELQTAAVYLHGVALERVWAEFDAEVGGVAATVTFKLMAGC